MLWIAFIINTIIISVHCQRGGKMLHVSVSRDVTYSHSPSNLLLWLVLLAFGTINYSLGGGRALQSSWGVLKGGKEACFIKSCTSGSRNKLNVLQMIRRDQRLAQNLFLSGYFVLICMTEEQVFQLPLRSKGGISTASVVFCVILLFLYWFFLICLKYFGLKMRKIWDSIENSWFLFNDFVADCKSKTSCLGLVNLFYF